MNLISILLLAAFVMGVSSVSHARVLQAVYQCTQADETDKRFPEASVRLRVFTDYQTGELFLKVSIKDWKFPGSASLKNNVAKGEREDSYSGLISSKSESGRTRNAFMRMLIDT